MDWLALTRQCLSEVSHYEQIGCVVLMEEPFSLTKDQVTVKGSLRRQKIEQDYRSEIDAAYQRAKREHRHDRKPS